MTRDEVQAWLTAQYPSPVVEFKWRTDPIAFNGTATLDVSGLVKDHEQVFIGIWAPNNCSDDDELNGQLQHSIDGARNTINELIEQKGAAA
jgi:hypothetical protein